MNKLLLPVLTLVIGLSILSCKSSGPATPPVFCDTACFSDTVRFTGTDKLAPYVIISAKNCEADTISWSYAGMDKNKKMGLEDFLNKKVYLNKDYVRCFFKDADYAWLLFNDCSNGRGYSLKLPLKAEGNISRKTSNINSLDKKFSVADNLVAYTDRGNIFVEDMATGKTAMMTFGQNLDIDYDYLHDYIDSVNVTNSRIWVKVKVGKEWKELKKDITLQ